MGSYYASRGTVHSAGGRSAKRENPRRGGGSRPGAGQAAGGSGVGRRVGLAVRAGRRVARGQPGLPGAVGEVDPEPDHHPDQEPQPGQGGEVQHQVERHHDRQDRDRRHPRDAEGPLQVGAGPAEHQDGRRDHDEGEQGADVHQFGQLAQRHQGGDQGDHDAGGDRHPDRGAGAGADLREGGRQQAIPAHREEHPGLAEHQHHHHRGQAGQGADRDDGGEGGLADRTERRGQRRLGVDLVVLHHPGDDQGDGHVEHGDDGQRAEDAARQVPLRVAGLLRRRGDDVEPDEREEHQGGGRGDPGVAERPDPQAEVLQQRDRRLLALGRRRTRRRDERAPVAELDEEQAGEDHQQDDRHLDRHDHGVHLGGQPDPVAEHRRHDQDDDPGDQVRLRRSRFLVVEPQRQLHPELGGQVGEVLRPADRDGGGAQRQLQDQVPADDPGDQLAQGGVAEGVGRARHRHGRGELGVAEPGQRAGHGGEQKRQGHGRPGQHPGRAPGQDEDAGADGDPDPEDGQVPGAQGPVQAVFGLVGLGDRVLDGLGAEDVHCRPPRSRSLEPQANRNRTFRISACAGSGGPEAEDVLQRAVAAGADQIPGRRPGGRTAVVGLPAQGLVHPVGARLGQHPAQRRGDRRLGGRVHHGDPVRRPVAHPQRGLRAGRGQRLAAGGDPLLRPAQGTVPEQVVQPVQQRRRLALGGGAVLPGGERDEQLAGGGLGRRRDVRPGGVLQPDRDRDHQRPGGEPVRGGQHLLVVGLHQRQPAVGQVDDGAEAAVVRVAAVDQLLAAPGRARPDHAGRRDVREPGRHQRRGRGPDVAQAVVLRPAGPAVQDRAVVVQQVDAERGRAAGGVAPGLGPGGRAGHRGRQPQLADQHPATGADRGRGQHQVPADRPVRGVRGGGRGQERVRQGGGVPLPDGLHQAGPVDPVRGPAVELPHHFRRSQHRQRHPGRGVEQVADEQPDPADAERLRPGQVLHLPDRVGGPAADRHPDRAAADPGGQQRGPGSAGRGGAAAGPGRGAGRGDPLQRRRRPVRGPDPAALGRHQQHRPGVDGLPARQRNCVVAAGRGVQPVTERGPQVGPRVGGVDDRRPGLDAVHAGVAGGEGRERHGRGQQDDDRGGPHPGHPQQLRRRALLAEGDQHADQHGERGQRQVQAGDHPGVLGHEGREAADHDEDRGAADQQGPAQRRVAALGAVRFGGGRTRGDQRGELVQPPGQPAAPGPLLRGQAADQDGPLRDGAQQAGQQRPRRDRDGQPGQQHHGRPGPALGAALRGQREQQRGTEGADQAEPGQAHGQRGDHVAGPDHRLGQHPVEALDRRRHRLCPQPAPEPPPAGLARHRRAAQHHGGQQRGQPDHQQRDGAEGGQPVERDVAAGQLDHHGQPAEDDRGEQPVRPQVPGLLVHQHPVAAPPDPVRPDPAEQEDGEREQGQGGRGGQAVPGVAARVQPAALDVRQLVEDPGAGHHRQRRDRQHGQDREPLDVQRGHGPAGHGAPAPADLGPDQPAQHQPGQHQHQHPLGEAGPDHGGHEETEQGVLQAARRRVPGHRPAAGQGVLQQVGQGEQVQPGQHGALPALQQPAQQVRVDHDEGQVEGQVDQHPAAQRVGCAGAEGAGDVRQPAVGAVVGEPGRAHQVGERPGPPGRVQHLAGQPADRGHRGEQDRGQGQDPSVPPRQGDRPGRPRRFRFLLARDGEPRSRGVGLDQLWEPVRDGLRCRVRAAHPCLRCPVRAM